MSSCDLELALDRPDRRYKVGETITGMVGVKVNADCTCNGLTVTLQWRTHGKGNRATGTAIGGVVYKGPWKAGERHVHPFEFKLPRGPVTYHGHDLNVDWYVTATADLPWALDPRAEVDLVASPDGAPEPYDLGPKFAESQRLAIDTLPVVRIVTTIVAGAFMAVGGSLAFTIAAEAIRAAANGDAATQLLAAVPFAVIPTAFAGFGAWQIYKIWSNVLAERALGPVRLEPTAARLLPGQPLNVALAFTPRRDLAIDAIRATFTGTEMVSSGSGTNRSSYTHIVHEQVIDLPVPPNVRANNEVSSGGQFTVPGTAAPSFAATDNELRWAVKVDVSVRSAPDWSGVVVIGVLPAP